MGTAAPGHTRGRKWEADAYAALPNSWAPKLGQRPRSIAATTLPQPSAIGLTHRLVGLQTRLAFWGLSGQSSIRRGRGEGGQRPLHPKLGKSFPPHLHSSLSSCTHKHHCILLCPSNSTYGQDEAGSELCPSAAHSTGWDFTRAKAQMDGPFTWRHLFFSNLFLNGVVILIGQWMTRMAGKMKSKVQQDS